MSTTACPPRAATRRPVSTARSIAWTCASAGALSVSSDDGLQRAGLASPGAPRGAPRRARRSLEVLLAGERAGEAAQRLGLAGPRAADDRDARAAAERREPLDRLQREVVGVQRDALGRVAARQVVVLRALGDLVGRAAVDRVDADERRVALGAARRADRARDLVARDELAAAHLGGGDVDVVVGGLRRRTTRRKPEPLGEQLDGAAGVALLGGRWRAGSRRAALAVGTPVAIAVPVTARSRSAAIAVASRSRSPPRSRAEPFSRDARGGRAERAVGAASAGTDAASSSSSTSPGSRSRVRERPRPPRRERRAGRSSPSSLASPSAAVSATASRLGGSSPARPRLLGARPGAR